MMHTLWLKIALSTKLPFNHPHTHSRMVVNMVAEQLFRSTFAAAQMEQYIKEVGEHPSGLLVDEWNLLSVVFKNVVDS